MSQAQHIITDHITDNIATWTSAILAKSSAGRGSSNKYELYGIKKLRELILELAVRGKLVPQDPSDEPASVLLERIAAEKAELIKAKKIKKPKALPEITEDEKPFDLPDGWEWVRLGDIGNIGSSSRVHKKDWKDNGIPFYRAREIVKLSQNAPFQNELFISDELFQELSSKGLVPEHNDIMLTGVGTIGVPYIVQKEDEFYFKDASVLILKNTYRIPPRFLSELFKSSYWKKFIHANSMGTTVHTLTIVRANEVLIPLPPVSEQQRIVKKVDELMALCDQLEQQTEASIEAHATLVETLLSTLTNSADADELAQNWARIAEHFDTLFTTDKSIDALKQTILQLAVMGKLVPQNPDDEPASVLLDKIATEKAILIKEKKIKKQKPLSSISDDEKPFELPKGWEWCRFGQLGYDLGGGTPSKSNPNYWNGDIPWVSPKDMKVDYIETAIDNVTEKAIEESTIKVIPQDSLIMVVRGMILAHSFPVALTKKPVTINQDMKALVFSELKPCFLLLLLKGFKERMISLVDRSSHGTCKLISDKLWMQIFAIPPINEQHRIVKKVDELFEICDQLKDKLQQSRQTQVHLTDALVDQALT